MNSRFALIVPTYNAGQLWASVIRSISVQSIAPDVVLVVDSGSRDATVAQSLEAGFQVNRIESSDYNHGGTRKMASEVCSGNDFVVFITQDSLLASVDALEKILLPFSDQKVAAICGRQLPRKSASLIEAHARIYNYPEVSFVRSEDDIGKYGLKTAFLSNSFAAYRLSALNEIGGFPGDVIFGEDMYVAAKLLKAGYEIAYAADACVYHSHNYSLGQEFKRYFDMGVFHACEPWLRREFGGAEDEGVKFVVSEFKYLLKHAFWRIAEVMLRTVFRYTGFRLGLMEKWFPLWLKKTFAMNKRYFTS